MGVSPEVHDHLHSFEHVKLQVVKTAPDRQLLNLLSVNRLVTICLLLKPNPKSVALPTDATRTKQ